ncbi:MAG: cell wall-binding repeat-containing protein, partial [Eubacterium sp.]|nr:cell wall-binding repeat-containing protein [Eubacterium sp.]
ALGLPVDRLEQATVTGQEMTQLLDHLVWVTDGEKLEQWKNVIPDFRKGDKPISRYDGIVALFLAAELLGQDQLNNDEWGTIHSAIGESCWEKVHWNDEYFSTVDAGRPAMEWHLYASSYFYSYGRFSLFSGKTLFDYDENSNSMRPDENLTWQEAVLAVARMHDSIEENLSEERDTTELDENILSNAETTRKKILNTESDWTLGEGGTVYYVSPNGNDENDGLTPETAWQTLDKVNSAALEGCEYLTEDEKFPEYTWACENKESWAHLNSGDVVLFERGGLWRGVLRTREGVAYSAYGEGQKPEIWGSPENGTGGEKWSLLDGTDNIWVFYRPLQDCGGILLGENTVAQKKMAFWDDDTKSYLDVGNDQQFSNEVLEAAEELDLTKLEDLYFFNYIEHEEPILNQPPEFGAFGTLYLRCDAGNPGEIYDSIEFFTGNNGWNQNLVSTANGVTLDNLSFRYGSAGVQMQGYSNVVVQNCCISWVGGITLGYEIQIDGVTFGRTGASIMRTGDGIMSGGTNNIIKNNYITQTFDWAITVEEYAGSWTDGTPEVPRKDTSISGNLMEYCAGGVLVVDWYALEYCIDGPTFTNVTIEDNQILYSAMTNWAHLEDYSKGNTYLSGLGLMLNPGVSGIKIHNNTFYFSSEISQLLNVCIFETGEDVFSFDGNTYVQRNYTPMISFEKRTALGNTQYSSEYKVVKNSITASEEIEELLYDKNVQAEGPSFAVKQSLSHISGEEVRENESTADCKNEGEYDLVVYCTICNGVISSEHHTVDKLGHKYEDGACIRCGEPDPNYQVPSDNETEVYRIAGKTRYETSLKIADALKADLGVEKFDTVILADGRNFPDALAGSYLAGKMNAPILMANEKSQYAEPLRAYIRENLKSRGTIYVLGGTGAVPESVLNGLSGYKVERLAGANRYETNLMILEEAGVSGEEILVCTGRGFADSLSASATGKPILLIGKSVTAEQKEFMSLHKGNQYYIIGGESAVSKEIESVVKDYGMTERISGSTRYETSILVAEAFFDGSEEAVLAYAKNFPDGLCGGPLALSKNAPLILTATGKEANAVTYTKNNSISAGAVLGGAGLISDEVVMEILDTSEINIW